MADDADVAESIVEQAGALLLSSLSSAAAAIVGSSTQVINKTVDSFKSVASGTLGSINAAGAAASKDTKSRTRGGAGKVEFPLPEKSAVGGKRAASPVTTPYRGGQQPVFGQYTSINNNKNDNNKTNINKNYDNNDSRNDQWKRAFSGNDDVDDDYDQVISKSNVLESDGGDSRRDGANSFPVRIGRPPDDDASVDVKIRKWLPRSPPPTTPVRRTRRAGEGEEPTSPSGGAESSVYMTPTSARNGGYGEWSPALGYRGGFGGIDSSGKMVGSSGMGGREIEREGHVVLVTPSLSEVSTLVEALEAPQVS